MTVPKRMTRTPHDHELLKLADHLLANYRKPEDLIGENGSLKQLTKMLVERALETELTRVLSNVVMLGKPLRRRRFFARATDDYGA